MVQLGPGFSLDIAFGLVDEDMDMAENLGIIRLMSTPFIMLGLRKGDSIS